MRIVNALKINIEINVTQLRSHNNKRLIEAVAIRKSCSFCVWIKQ
jgi:hypothetical protein